MELATGHDSLCDSWGRGQQDSHWLVHGAGGNSGALWASEGSSLWKAGTHTQSGRRTCPDIQTHRPGQNWHEWVGFLPVASGASGMLAVSVVLGARLTGMRS